jgi:Carboxypeptidase regulatory-like domain
MTKLFLVSLGMLALASAQQTDLHNQPSVSVGNNPRPGKGSTVRLIDGIVKDQAGKPIRGAIVQLKDMKTSKVIDLATTDDGKFAFRDLRMDIDYQVTAKNGTLSLVKKVSTYDTRHEVILTFNLEPPKQESKDQSKEQKQ